MNEGQNASDQTQYLTFHIAGEEYAVGILRVKDKGVFVFSGCSHAGIVNVCLHARDLFPDVPIYCVMGGLHLGGGAHTRDAGRL